MIKCNPLKILVRVTKKFVKAKGNDDLADATSYQSLIESILLPAKQTRLDILCGSSILSRFMDKPTKANMQGAEKILRYLYGTAEPKFVYQKQEDPVLLGQNDADWSGDQNDRKSTTGFNFTYGQHSGASSWQVRKQQTVALSSCEAEYQGLAAAAQEVLFLRQLICDLQHPQQ